MKRYEESLFTVRFVGPKLDTVGVGIYDLGLTLVAFQRLVHKAYLAKTDNVRKGAFPEKNQRQELSLQIGERRRESDAFGLIPIITDPMALQTLMYCADAVFNGVVGYYSGKVIERLRNEKDETKKLFIGSIYSEVTNIISRIDGGSAINGIEINAPSLPNAQPLLFDEAKKEQINALGNERFLGETQEITGDVFKLYPNSRIVSIRKSKRGKCTVFLESDLFDKIRYAEPGQSKVKFTGRPRYALGVETKTITEFEAYAIEFV
ncbi:MAG: hypothetical protein AB7I68_11975 [Porticoccaceae bacterium]